MSTVRKELVSMGRELVDAGLSPGRSGNLSIRTGNTIIMTPTNVSLGSLSVNALSIVSLDGTHLDGPRPSKEVPLHLAMYRRDPAAQSVVHVHSENATAASCVEPWSAHHAILPATPYLLMKVGQVPLIPYFAPGDPAQADAILRFDLTFSAALLANHGSIAAFPTLAQAQTAVTEIEEAARTALLIRGQNFRLLTGEQIVELTERNGTPWTPGVPSQADVATFVRGAARGPLGVADWDQASTGR
ncbi:class II aldolase/adducin family protein [Mycetocola sp. 2940]|uniref:class II aldolase/adducin family protein n=1 Tax=Mycetocola sp. 2940 TaxID=3156452 RepID=UPI003397048A